MHDHAIPFAPRRRGLSQPGVLLGTLSACLLLMAGPALAGPCRMPHLQAARQDDPGMLARDRAALDLYEACLGSEQAILTALDPAGARGVERQRRAVAALRQTLEAWQTAKEQAADRDRR
ncbi:hypothetical protein [Oleisolibacter albus]|uniref:hypothetical protein n=1 Tax=Oleisolibacter albus TaxID=2171757 RepID=UPI000DF4C99F|nr:hypothetical protein [Oleisolibacter albus]